MSKINVSLCRAEADLAPVAAVAIAIIAIIAIIIAIVAICGGLLHHFRRSQIVQLPLQVTLPGLIIVELRAGIPVLAPTVVGVVPAVGVGDVVALALADWLVMLAFAFALASAFASFTIRRGR